MAKIILLNGTSSSGKSSIAKLLHQKLVNPPWMYFQVDDFLRKLPLEHIQQKEVFIDILPKIIFGFHSSIVSMAESGVNCIVDHVFQEDGWYEDFFIKAKNIDTINVGLHCPKEILEQREKERGDREIGLAASQIEKVHRGISYSLEFDTSIVSAKECSEKIISFLA